MKISLFLVLLYCVTPVARGQQLSWDICMDGRKQLTGTEGKKADTLQLTVSDPASRKDLEIRVREKPSNVEWTYTLNISDTAGHTLSEHQLGGKKELYRVSITEILAFFPKYRFLRLHLDQHPANPEISIRSKRTLLAIIQLKP